MDSNITEIEIAYVAGLFDGEGDAVLGFYRTGRRGADGGRRRYPRLQARITNDDRRTLVWCCGRTGLGTVVPKKPKGNAWIVRTAQARQLLRMLLPYLRIKRKKVEQVLAEEAKLVRPKQGPVV